MMVKLLICNVLMVMTQLISERPCFCSLVSINGLCGLERELYTCISTSL